MTGRFILSLSNLILGIIETLLTLRIILKLLGASTAAPFVTWIYETTQPLLQPFSGMFPSPRLTDGLILEASALFALVAYALLGYLVEALIVQVTFFSKRNLKN